MALTDTISVGDVLAYRTLWDPYVMDSIRAINLCADSFDGVAKNPPAGYSSQELSDNATSYRKVADLFLQDWNQFAGKQPLEIVAESTIILNAQQDLVKRVGAMHTSATMCSGLKDVKAPSVDAQNEVLSRLEGLGIVTQGVLQLFTDSTTAGLQVIARDVVAPIAKGAATSLWDAIPWWGWVAGGVVGLAIVGPPVLAAAAPVLALRSSHHD